MDANSRIYLDNAATSWPKPTNVIEAVQHYLTTLGAPAGRGAYQEAVDVEQIIRRTRSNIALLLGTQDPNQIAFTHNGTDSLNQALYGFLQPGDHVVTSLAEHNSVLRPLRALQETRDVTVTRVPCDGCGLVSPDDIRAAVVPTTRLICLTHVSNVTGAVQPAGEIGQIAASHSIPFLLDAAQSLGHLPVDVDALGVSMLASPGHKGLLGPLGTGILFVRQSLWPELRSTRQGGTGTQSESDIHPDSMPEKLEAGNLNVPGIVGLDASLQFLAAEDVATIHERERTLADALRDGIEELDGVTTYSPSHMDARSGVLSASVADVDPRELASLLDSTHRIQTRAGFHCAPLVHQQLGTSNFGGTIRFSMGPFVTRDDIRNAVAAVKELVPALRP